MKNIGCFLLLFLIFSCGETETNPNIIVAEDVLPEDQTQAISLIENDKNAITKGSQKEMLIGSWQDADDAELIITISPEKYSTYLNGKKNWDNPWSLCDYIDYAPESENDNGKYVLVHLADKSAVFYAQEIIAITDNQLDVLVVKSSTGSGITKTFIRT
ncbi:MAG: hypothetical protein ACI8ZM_000082 [Crocinitomix sp.]|jgi:hypothetical protein